MTTRGDFALPLDSHRVKGLQAPDNPDRCFGYRLRAKGLRLPLQTSTKREITVLPLDTHQPEGRKPMGKYMQHPGRSPGQYEPRARGRREAGGLRKGLR
ncbi:MAG: hypothetical protein AB2797_09160 [Candidatus Thiodiazotropha sp.]